jgi:hypothetical protein
MSTQTPLWKQLLGACAGAAVAVVVYEAFLFVTPRLEAWVTLPTAPGVENQAGTNLDTKNDDDARRQAARNREIAAQFGASSSAISRAAWSAPSSVAPLHGAASSQASSVVSSAMTSSASGGLKGVVDATKNILGTGGSSSATSATSSRASSWSSARSSVRSVTTPVVTKGVPSVPHAEKLPNSGVGLWVIASAAFGATFERYRIRRKLQAQA